MRTNNSALIDKMIGNTIPEGIVRNTLLVLFGTFLLILSAKVQAPFYPVPMTMQTMVVLLIGSIFGWRLGGATILAYLAEGAAGFPVFASQSAGIGYFMGPTAGYLFGFLVAAVFVGFLSEKGMGRTFLSSMIIMALAHAIILLFGYFWLANMFGFSVAYAKGVAPFYWATLLKTSLGSLTLTYLWKMPKRG